ncbi:hypothetical protein BO85DRAFT_450618 [Aspergillus piperis CBS 112811]|uniref:Uncharacterized protein n=1 Tax=Aspergillus piperis CBS 112811 TaxID=1448313 RepID=A0A8G1R4B8_9EURO|nr:hypothetical protein BO85DRAFT_450618 [Aspergillus piperis CBS 112811]RAH56590.1 hypothetical protein BO85DRAFT_450618 [Aspergillus piperis CBS 112811]
MAHIDSKEPPFHATLHYDTVHETERELSGLSTWREPEGSKLIIDAWFYPSAPILSLYLWGTELFPPILAAPPTSSLATNSLWQYVHTTHTTTQ